MSNYQFDEYQQTAHKTAVYPGQDNPMGLAYLALGLNGEAGEVAEKIKKAMRDEGGVISDERRYLLRKECGDVLWYLTEMCSALGFSLGEVAAENIVKLMDRKARGVLQGSGDTR